MPTGVLAVKTQFPTYTAEVQRMAAAASGIVISICEEDSVKLKKFLCCFFFAPPELSACSQNTSAPAQRVAEPSLHTTCRNAHAV